MYQSLLHYLAVYKQNHHMRVSTFAQMEAALTVLYLEERVGGILVNDRQRVYSVVQLGHITNALLLYYVLAICLGLYHETNLWKFLQ